MFRRTARKFLTESKWCWLATQHYGFDAPCFAKVKKPYQPTIDPEDDSSSFIRQHAQAHSMLPSASLMNLGGENTNQESEAYAKALLYLSGGHRCARDYIAGWCVLITASQSILELALQYVPNEKDLENFLELTKNSSGGHDEEEVKQLTNCLIYDSLRAGYEDDDFGTEELNHIKKFAAKNDMSGEHFDELVDLVKEEIRVLKLKHEVLHHDSSK